MSLLPFKGPLLSPVVAGLWRVDLGVVNAYLVAGDGEMVLVDTGPPGSETKVVRALDELGLPPHAVRNVVVTHHHPDHAGALAAVLRETGAQAWMHAADAAEVRLGNGFRPYRPASGVLSWALERVVVRPTPPRFEPAPVAREVTDGDVLPGALRAVWAPGHSAGQVALVWPEHGGVLVAADACTNLPVLAPSVIYEDLDVGRETLRQLAALDVDTAVFGHGRPIVGGAAARLRAAFVD